MIYRVELHATALAQISGLPRNALDALVSTMAHVSEQPWDAVPLYADEPEYRQAIFGDLGPVSFYVDDTTEIIRVFDITWTG